MLDFRVETFLTVCRTMHFTRAAEELHITQPAVSQHIRALEEQYGVKLFHLQGRQLQLTESGRLLFRAASAMRHDALRVSEALRQQGNRRTLRFGATLTIGEYVMPGPLLRLLEEEPDLQLRMLTANTRELLERLDRGELDFAIVEGYFDRQAYDSLTYCVQPFLPVCAPEYSFARPVRRLEDLLGERLVIRENGSGTREILEKMLQQFSYGVSSFRHVSQISSFAAIKSLVAAGEGITFLYRPAAEKELREGTLVPLDIEGFPLLREFNFVMPEGIAPEERYLSFHSFCKDFLAGAGDEPGKNRKE